ncbi:MAG: hypothetical protein JWQ38_1587 [Flavipsychrobacter sp.]|nr:hypothetical protein [Flavipsychrobacter sp.]
MKKTLSLALVMIMAVSGVFAKENQNSADSKTVKGKNISVTYTQPTTTDGKVVFGTTELTVTKDCLIGGNKQKLKAGTYSVTTKASGGEWTFVVTKPSKNNTAGEVVLGTWALAKHATTSVPSLTMTPNNDGVLMEINDWSVQLPVQFAN